jgi:hypothetical protein
MVHFGAAGYEDFTMHKDEARKKNYIQRHKPNQDWTRSGVDTAGFYARWLLWNKPSLQESLRDMNNRFKNVTFTLQT